jgi:hypothetical protein
MSQLQATAAAEFMSKSSMVLDRWNTGIASSYLASDIDVRMYAFVRVALFCVDVDLTMDWSFMQGVIPNVITEIHNFKIVSKMQQARKRNP